MCQQSILESSSQARGHFSSAGTEHWDMHILFFAHSTTPTDFSRYNAVIITTTLWYWYCLRVIGLLRLHFVWKILILFKYHFNLIGHDCLVLSRLFISVSLLPNCPKSTLVLHSIMYNDIIVHNFQIFHYMSHFSTDSMLKELHTFLQGRDSFSHEKELHIIPTTFCSQLIPGRTNKQQMEPAMTNVIRVTLNPFSTLPNSLVCWESLAEGAMSSPHIGLSSARV